ncbi:MAG: hypothetical protein JF924_03585 [Candidatus Dormibacteraeota bacterium]|nr:hypothetical protein [Candidatus Dormibacteraeota bacterium]
MRRLILALLITYGGRQAYRLLTTGAVTIDIGVGRRLRRLGPHSCQIAAAPETVFDVIASP